MNISKQNKHNKYGKRILSMLLAFVFMVTLLPPQKVNAVGRTPIDMVKDGRSDYCRWDQVIGKNDIPDDGKWHRMLLFYQYDEVKKRGYYLSGDAYLKNGTYNGYDYTFYTQAKYAEGDSDIDLNDDYFFTETHRNGFFVKRVGYSAYDDNILIKLRTSDSNGKPRKYIGVNINSSADRNNNRMTFVDSESEAFTFKMLTYDSTEWTNRVGKGEIRIWGEDDDDYLAISDEYLDKSETRKHYDDTFGVFPYPDKMIPFTTYLKMKMYLGESFSETYITTDFEVKAGASQTLSGDTLIQPGVTVTVQEGGTLAISGALYNSGTINNNGTIVFNRDSTLAYYATNGEGGVYDYSAGFIGADFNCKGNSSLIVCEGAKIILPKGLKMTENSVCHNSGLMIFEDGLKMSGNATFYNRNIGLVESGSAVGGRYYELKMYRPMIRSEQESTIQGDGGSIPVMKYWTESYPYDASLINEVERGYIHRYPKKWFDIGKNTKFYNEGTVIQNTFIYTDKGVNWCEGNPPDAGYLRQNKKSKKDYWAAIRKMKDDGSYDEDSYDYEQSYQYDYDNELDYNFILPYKL